MWVNPQEEQTGLEPGHEITQHLKSTVCSRGSREQAGKTKQNKKIHHMGNIDPLDHKVALRTVIRRHCESKRQVTHSTVATVTNKELAFKV